MLLIAFGAPPRHRRDKDRRGPASPTIASPREEARPPSPCRLSDIGGAEAAEAVAPQPNRLWVGDLSYPRCWEGVVFFALIIDVHSRYVVGWQLAGHMRIDLVLDALRWRSGPVSLAPTSNSGHIPIAEANPDSTGARTG